MFRWMRAFWQMRNAIVWDMQIVRAFTTHYGTGNLRICAGAGIKTHRACNIRIYVFTLHPPLSSCRGRYRRRRGFVELVAATKSLTYCVQTHLREAERALLQVGRDWRAPQDNFVWEKQNMSRNRSWKNRRKIISRDKIISFFFSYRNILHYWYISWLCV